MRKKVLLAVAFCICLALLPLSTPASGTDAFNLSYVPADAVFNDDGSMLYVSDKEGRTVYAIDTETFEQQSISFDRMPESMYYRQGKLYVSLCDQEHSRYWDEEEQTGAFAVIDTSDFELLRINPINLDPYDIVVGNDGTVYIGSGSGQWTEMHSFTPEGELREKLTSFAEKTELIYHTQLNRIYSITMGSMTCKQLNSDGTFVNAHVDEERWSYHGDYSLYSNSILSPDGLQIFNSSGNVFTCDSDVEKNMKFKLSFGQSWTGVTFGQDGESFFIATGTSQITAYDYESLEATAVYTTTRVPRYLFAKENTLVVVSVDFYGNQTCSIELIDLSDPFKTIETEVTERALEMEEGKVLLDTQSITKVVFNEDTVYIADVNENAVLAVDTAALTEAKIIFHEKVNSLDYANGEVFVGFGQRGSITILDAVTLEIKDKLFTGVPFQDMAIGKDGFIYIISTTGRNVVYSCSRSGQQLSMYETPSGYGNLVPHPIENKLYWVDMRIHQPRDIKAIIYENGIIRSIYNSRYHVDYSFGTKIKISPDGEYIFSNRGSVFTNQSPQEEEIEYKDSFIEFTDLAFDLEGKRIFTSDENLGLRVYDYDTYELLGGIKTVFPVEEMSFCNGQIIALSARYHFDDFGNSYSSKYLELLSPADIVPLVPEKIHLRNDPLFLSSGHRTPLDPYLVYTNGSTVPIRSLDDYTSSDDAIATVDERGYIQAVSFGRATITISYEGLSRSVDVYVDHDVTELSVEGYPFYFSTMRSGYAIKLPKGTTAIPTVTYIAHSDLIVTVVNTTTLPGYTTVTVTDADKSFSKTYTLYFYHDLAVDEHNPDMPYYIDAEMVYSAGELGVEWRVEKNPEYTGSVSTYQYAVVQSFFPDMTPFGLSFIPKHSGTIWISIYPEERVIISVVDQFNQADYISVPLAEPLVISVP